MWWQCSCGNQNHVVYMQCDSARDAELEKRDPFHCIRCHGDRPSKTRIAACTSAWEKRFRDLLDVGKELYAVHVMPWKGCGVAVDAYLPIWNIIVCHDGSSHFKELPVDRDPIAKLPKLVKDRVFDDTAQQKGFKVMRLHWKDEEQWSECISKAVAECHDRRPVYTNSYAL